jgi:hypothetical protein
MEGVVWVEETPVPGGGDYLLDDGSPARSVLTLHLAEADADVTVCGESLEDMREYPAAWKDSQGGFQCQACLKAAAPAE